MMTIGSGVWGRTGVAGALLLGCGIVADGAVVGGESHFLGSCGGGCEDGLRCLEGICTLPCVDTALGCSGLGVQASCRYETLTPNTGSYCDLPCVGDASCTELGSQLECLSGFCRARAPLSSGSSLASTEARSPWWCLDQVPEPLPLARPLSNSALLLETSEWGTLAPLAGTGLTATLCSGVDLGCSSPLVRYDVQDGSVGDLMLPAGVSGVPVPEGFDGFVKFDVTVPPGTPDTQVFMPSAYYLSGVISGPVSVGPPVVMMQQGTFTAILQSAFPQVSSELVRERGFVQVTVYDCNGGLVPDARIEIDVAGQPDPEVIPFQLPGSRIPIAQTQGEPLYVSSSGAAGYLAVPPGTVQLSAYLGAEVEPFGTVQLGALAGQLTYGMIRPTYFLDASIPNSLNSLGATP